MENPAVQMAREALFKDNPVYQRAEEAGMARMTTCYLCGVEMPMKGAIRRELEPGEKRRPLCESCAGNETAVPVVVDKAAISRKTCFFCNDNLFYILHDGSVMCAGCKSVFYRGK